jgi:hypothetical protein
MDFARLFRAYQALRTTAKEVVQMSVGRDALWIVRVMFAVRPAFGMLMARAGVKVLIHGATVVAHTPADRVEGNTTVLDVVVKKRNLGSASRVGIPSKRV